mmetsp:Transcript_25438/g.24773  ORF Transcript_25438/g.24773 Transcript_25438/m.24773 type:complete len:164 (-) Transcript_25438:428-919(-)
MLAEVLSKLDHFEKVNEQVKTEANLQPKDSLKRISTNKAYESQTHLVYDDSIRKQCVKGSMSNHHPSKNVSKGGSSSGDMVYKNCYNCTEGSFESEKDIDVVELYGLVPQSQRNSEMIQKRRQIIKQHQMLGDFGAFAASRRKNKDDKNGITRFSTFRMERKN